MNFVIRPFQPVDLPAVIAIMGWTLELNDLRPERFARDWLMTPGFCPEHLLIATTEEPLARVLGFLLAPRQDALAPADRGFIAALGVHPEWRRQGIGHALLARAMADMREEAVREIDVADVPVRYFYPGVDRAKFPVALDLLTRGFGFAVRDDVASMGIDDSMVPRPQHGRLAPPLARLGPESVHLLRDFLLAEFDPGFWAFFEHSLRLSYSGEHVPSEVICWWEAGKPIGAVHFRDNRFGPLAVGEAARGRGIGKALTLTAIDRILFTGYRSAYFMMATAAVEPFYAKLGFTVLRRFSRLRLTL